MARRIQNKIVADHGDWLEVDISTAKHPCAVMKIDAPDWERIREAGYGRAFAMQCSNDKTPYVGIHHGCSTTQIHRLIVPGFSCCDHINHDKLDNRRDNIRGCTFSQNQMNRAVGKNSSSGVKGVGFVKATGRWRARLVLRRKEISIGYYATKEEAVCARKSAEKQHHGEFCHV